MALRIPLLIFFFVISVYFSSKIGPRNLIINKQISNINLSSDLLRIISFGNKRMFTALIWLKTLLESDHNHYEGERLNNWMYLRFDSITKLDPYFLEAYQFGGTYLSVIKDDIPGAKTIYDRGLKHYPNDYNLAFNAGFLYYFEIGDVDQGFKLLSKIQYDKQAPPFLPSLVSRIKAEQGDLANAYLLLKLAYQKNTDPRLKKRYEQSLYSLKAEIDLNCLNHKDTNKRKYCFEKDFKGNPYLLNDQGLYYSEISWRPFRPTKKGGKIPPTKND